MPYSPLNRRAVVSEEKRLQQSLSDSTRSRIVDTHRPLGTHGMLTEFTVNLSKLTGAELPSLPSGEKYDSLHVEIQQEQGGEEWAITIEPCLDSKPIPFSVVGVIGPLGHLKEVTYFHENSFGGSNVGVMKGHGTMFSAPEKKQVPTEDNAENVRVVKAAFAQFDSLLALVPAREAIPPSTDRPT